jgi:hypothetical protein
MIIFSRRGFVYSLFHSVWGLSHEEDSLMDPLCSYAFAHLNIDRKCLFHHNCTCEIHQLLIRIIYVAHRFDCRCIQVYPVTNLVGHEAQRLIFISITMKRLEWPSAECSIGIIDTKQRTQLV